jgi:hypothetical protein
MLMGRFLFPLLALCPHSLFAAASYSSSELARPILSDRPFFFIFFSLVERVINIIIAAFAREKERVSSSEFIRRKEGKKNLCMVFFFLMI